MTDERYVFMQDIKDKNSAKSGAYARKNGSKSKACALPSDHLTPAQLKKKNGPVISVRMSEPITLAAYKQLSPDLQYDYLANCISRYGATRTDLSRMLGVRPQTIWNWEKKFPQALPQSTGNTMANAKKWQSFLNGETTAQEVSDPTPETPTAIIPLTPDTPDIPAPQQYLRPDTLSLTISGTAAELSQSISALTSLFGDLTLSVNVSICPKEDLRSAS